MWGEEVPWSLQVTPVGDRGLAFTLPVCAGVPKVHGGHTDPCVQTSTPGTPWVCHMPPGGSSPSLPNSLTSTLPSWVLHVGLPGTSWDVTLGPMAIMSLLVCFYAFHEPASAALLAFPWGSWPWLRPSGLPAMVRAAVLLFLGPQGPCLLGLPLPSACPSLHSEGCPCVCVCVAVVGWTRGWRCPRPSALPHSGERSGHLEMCPEPQTPASLSCSPNQPNRPCHHRPLAPVPPTPHLPAHVCPCPLGPGRAGTNSVFPPGWPGSLLDIISCSISHERFHLCCYRHHWFRAVQGGLAVGTRAPAG